MGKGDLTASSILELKAELAKKDSEFRTARTAGLQAKLSGKPRNVLDTLPSKKAKESRPTNAEDDLWEKTRAKLEEKTRIYEKLQKGDDDSVSESFKDNLLVDFNRQFHENKEEIFAKARLEANEIQVQQKAQTEVEMVEVEDEFGRTVMVSKSELDSKKQADLFIEQMKLESSLTHMETVLNEDTEPVHFDDTTEIRTKGVGFYRFSQLEGERRRQMDELGCLRQDTVETRTKAMILTEQRRLMKESRLEKIKERRARLAKDSPAESKTDDSKEGI